MPNLLIRQQKDLHEKNPELVVQTGELVSDRSKSTQAVLGSCFGMIRSDMLIRSD